MKLVSVYDTIKDGSEICLYRLLGERTPEQSISHRGMPTLEEHQKFIRRKPYRSWFMIENNYAEWVGSIYLSKQNEIGIFIFKAEQGNGHAYWAAQQLKRIYRGERLLANINPANTASIEFFKKFGAKHIQNTYQLEEN